LGNFLLEVVLLQLVSHNKGMKITQEQLIGWAREIDSQLAIPNDPEDLSTPVDFGTAGIVVMSDNSPMLIATGDDYQELLENESVKVFAQGYGSFFLVTYGGAVQQDEETGENSIHIARCVMGMTYEGVNTALMRCLDNDEIVIDEDISTHSRVHEMMSGVFQ
jgi:hypothetical protein